MCLACSQKRQQACMTGAERPGAVGVEPRKLQGQIVYSLSDHCKEFGFYSKDRKHLEHSGDRSNWISLAC